MNEIITYSNCPVCKSSAIKFVLKAMDHTVSRKTFSIWQCTDCSFRFTQDIPAISSIGQYYQSDNYISHSNTSKGIINRLYHSIRKITLKQKRRLLKSSTSLSTGSLLDIGAGTGAFASFMQSSGWRITALEPDETARRIARETNRINLLPPDQLFQLTAESFDTITMWHVL